MARSHEEQVRVVSEWKNFISSVDNIPLNPNHTYKDENDIYERLTEYVKDWAESVFGVYTNNNGELVNLPEDEEGTECKSWREDVAGKITPLAGDWYQVALKGGKKGVSLNLPQIDQNVLEQGEAGNQARDEIKDAVHSTFFPAYRALRDSFSKRWWFEWIFNHKQYVAERDSLKVMTSLITSMTGYTQEELDAKYVEHKKIITEKDIANDSIEFSNRKVNINEPEEDLFKDEKKAARYIKVEKRGKIVRLEEVNDELFTDEKRFDERFVTDEPTGEVLDIDYNEPIVEYMTAEEKLERFDINGNENIDEMCLKFMTAFNTTEETEDVVWRALHLHMYGAMLDAAKQSCSIYDACKEMYKGDKFKQEFAKITKKSVKNLFETAFKILGEEDSREIVKTVNGKEVREKIGGSLFGIKTLKDRIVVAQKITNVMLANRTPVGFYPDLSGGVENNIHILENADAISEHLKTNYANKYGESEINAAIKSAKNEFGVTYRGEKPLTDHCFEIGYRPDPSRIFAEQKVLGEAQKMIKKELIKDEAIKAVVNANVAKWKVVSGTQKSNPKIKMQDVEKKWIETDKKLAQAHKDYNATETEKAVLGAMEQYKQQKKENPEPVKVDLANNQNVAIVPPVDPKPVAINPPKREK